MPKKAVGKPIYLVPDDARVIRWSEIQTLYDRYKSTYRVAEELGISRGRISDILFTLGADIEKPGGRYGQSGPGQSTNPRHKPRTNPIPKRRDGLKVFADE